MHKIDFMKLTAFQREILATLVRPLSNNEVARLLKIVEMVTPSPGVVSEATKQAVLERFNSPVNKSRLIRTSLVR